MKQIEYIPIELLSHHPDNPRKDLGDLSELASSIEKSGIMQNLTVVPDADDEFGGYLVVIGNRRLEAAKIAQLEELPCIVSDMTYEEQLQTMLVENMNRSDLTPYEQAKGFQMLLDYGVSVEDIADKSGFSVSTVRRRVKLNELDEEAFKRAQERGATLFDFEELNKIKDITARNRLLDTIGTKNFEMELKKAITHEKEGEAIANIIENVSQWATRIYEKKTYGDRDYSYYTSFYPQSSNVEKPDEKGEYLFFHEDGSRYVEIYKKIDKSEYDKRMEEQKRQREKEDRIREKFNELSKQMLDCRIEFIKNMTNSDCQKFAPVIAEMVLFALTVKTLYYNDTTKFDQKIMDRFYIEQKDVLPTDNEIYKDECKIHPLQLTLRTVYSSLDRDMSYWSNTYYNDRAPVEHKGNERLDTIYSFLCRMGYELSDDELSAKNGTHQYFAEAEKLKKES